MAATHVASISERMGAMGGGKPMRPAPQMHEGGESKGHSELHDHGDGTFHTVTADGKQTEHPHIGHAIIHLAKYHESDGAHSHVHHHDGGHTSHHAKEGGEITGPYESDDLDGVKDSMAEATGEDGGYEHGSGSGKEYANKGESHSKGDLF